MSLYNQIFKVNPFAQPILLCLGIDDPNLIPRFRDVRCIDQDGQVLIEVYARIGGGNRNTYQEAIDAIRQHPYFLHDKDDDFDSTYLYLTFKTHEKFHGILRAIMPFMDNRSPREKWDTLFANMKDPNTQSPDAERAKEVGKAIFEQINSAMRNPDGEAPTFINV